MKLESNNYERLDYRKPPFKNVFVNVRNRLKKEYKRDISADAVNKAYRRGESIVFKLVQEEVEKCIKIYEKELLTKKVILEKKKVFENNVNSRLNAIEA
jgi:hypothetical protein